MDDARKVRLQHFGDWSGWGNVEEYDDVDGKSVYGTLAIHIRNFANIRTEDFSNMQSPGERAERLRGAVSAGRRFLLMVKKLNSVSDYRDCVVDCLDYKQLEKEVLDECNRPGSKIDWAIREAAMDASIKAYGRESEGKGGGYLYSDEAGMRAESRHASLGDYEAELRGKIAPMVVKHTFGRFEIPLQEYLESVLESIEDDAYWVMRERHILPRPGVDYPNKTYITRYLAGSFCTLFCIPPDEKLALTMLGAAGLVSPLGRFVGALLAEQVTREDVKNILKNYPPSGIRVRPKRGEEDW